MYIQYTFTFYKLTTLQKNEHSEKAQGVSLNVSYLISTYYIESNNLHSIRPKVY